MGLQPSPIPIIPHPAGSRASQSTSIIPWSQVLSLGRYPPPWRARAFSKRSRGGRNRTDVGHLMRVPPIQSASPREFLLFSSLVVWYRTAQSRAEYLGAGAVYAGSSTIATVLSLVKTLDLFRSFGRGKVVVFPGVSSGDSAGPGASYSNKGGGDVKRGRYFLFPPRGDRIGSGARRAPDLPRSGLRLPRDRYR